MVGLTVSPEISLMDEPVKIQAWGLPPDQVVTLAAWLKNEKGQIFHSRAFYKTDMEGKVDLEKTPATGGDFHGVCPMGLFWALKPKIPFKKLNKRDVVGSPFLVHIELYSSLELNVSEHFPAATKVIERWYAAPGVQRILIREGRIRGELFLPPGEGPFLGIIDMFGGVGGLQVFRSSLLASRGFASLALAYFAYDDLPKLLDELDLTYFEEAVQFLCNHPEVSGDGVGVIGICKGGEIALAMASFLPQVAATVCINGLNAANAINIVYGDHIMKAIPPKTERLLSTDFWSYSYTKSQFPGEISHRARYSLLCSLVQRSLDANARDESLMTCCSQDYDTPEEDFPPALYSCLTWCFQGNLLPLTGMLPMQPSPCHAINGETPHLAEAHGSEDQWRLLPSSFHSTLEIYK
ncbi:acyl-coenzyme A amino acid N-acyltransferase 1-like isoform X2 [Ranitomeya variabilis]|uniref:acyl-coenzyme A amino acid N-acyltransferase 1-like isoform X2 n=1 Tax=Ranitomeya variabilis TaxID=490064 RepID=UPI004056F06D